MKIRLLGILIFSNIALCCSTFELKQSPLKIFGKGFDWPDTQGAIFLNQRHVQKESLLVKPTDHKAQWVSHYGSVTFNQHGREFPLGGMNEAGLVIDIMMGGSGQEAVDLRPTVNELQWIQFQLDQYATVKDVVEHAADTRVSWIFANVHYLICDLSGTCAVFELDGGKVTVHSGDQMPVNALTNNLYSESMAFLKQHEGFGGTLPIPPGTGSLERFARVSDLVTRFVPTTPSATVGFAFSVLNNANPDSAWHIVYNPVDQQITWRTRVVPTAKSIEVKNWDFSCGGAIAKPVKTQNVNLASSGSITSKLVDYSVEENHAMVEFSLKSQFTGVPAEVLTALIAAAANYPATTVCLSP